MQSLLNSITKKQIRTDLPDIKVGDTVQVNVRIIEGNKERIQMFQGDVIAIKNGGISKTFIVRKISNGIAVERVFMFNSPKIASIKVVRHGKVRRAKLYYLRDKFGKKARITQRIGNSAEDTEEIEVTEEVPTETAPADVKTTTEVVETVEEVKEEATAEVEPEEVVEETKTEE